MENTINDCFVSVVGEKPSEEQITSIYKWLPSSIKNEAEEWGWNDTVVRDAVYV